MELEQESAWVPVDSVGDYEGPCWVRWRREPVLAFRSRDGNYRYAEDGEPLERASVTHVAIVRAPQIATSATAGAAEERRCETCAVKPSGLNEEICQHCGITLSCWRCRDSGAGENAVGGEEGAQAEVEGS